jgi:hypothetical protein
MLDVQSGTIFDETLNKYPALENRVIDFIKLKTTNPSQRFGSSDYPFNSDGPLGKMKLKHAHLSQDVSIFYKIAGSPSTLYIFGLFSHNESGTGNTKNNKLQKSLAARLKNQFPDLKDDLEYFDDMID